MNRPKFTPNRLISTNIGPEPTNIGSKSTRFGPSSNNFGTTSNKHRPRLAWKRPSQHSGRFVCVPSHVAVSACEDAHAGAATVKVGRISSTLVQPQAQRAPAGPLCAFRACACSRSGDPPTQHERQKGAPQGPQRMEIQLFRVRPVSATRSRIETVVGPERVASILPVLLVLLGRSDVPHFSRFA